MRRLVLFDIDGTIMSAAGAGRIAIKRALEAHWGPVPHADRWSFGGKTDPQICHELLGHAGVERATVEALLPQVLETYLTQLAQVLPETEGVHLKPGVTALLDALATEPGVCLGLLTGNLAEGAKLKLDRFGLAPRFRLGAYGSDHGDRPELPAIAVARALALTGHAHRGKEIVIIGDTEHDVRCGASLDARAIGVATGQVAIETLRAHGADHVFSDLSATEAVLEAILR